ncbi:MAG: hypothetical protein AAGF92_01490 [Myxococcota bacterium]
MFKPFEKEVIRKLVGDALGRDVLDRVVAASELEEDWSPVGYFLTVRDAGLPKERDIFEGPPTTTMMGSGAGAEVGFIVFVTDRELTLECFRWDGSDDRLPRDFRDSGVEVFARDVPSLKEAAPWLAGREPAEPTQQPRDQVETALRALLNRKNKESFVVVSARSDRFVQFAMDQGGLSLDFPADRLTREEMERAHHLFRSRGGVLQDMELFDVATGEQSGTIKTFRVELNDDATRGADLALQILREVHQIPKDATLDIEEN